MISNKPIDVRLAVLFEAFAPEICDLACGHRGGDAFGKTSKVFDQYDSQRRRQRPQFAEVQRADVLIRGEELREQRFVEGAVGVRHERPCHAVYARQTGKMRVDQNRQIAEVASRQPVVNLLDLRDDHMEVVEQPLTGGIDFYGARLLPYVTVCLAQYRDVLLQPRKELGRRSICFCLVDRGEAATMLLEARHTEDFGTDRRFDRPPVCVEQRKRLCAGVRHMPAKFVVHGTRSGRERGTDDDHRRHDGEYADESRRKECIERFGHAPHAVQPPQCEGTLSEVCAQLRGFVSIHIMRLGWTFSLLGCFSGGMCKPSESSDRP